MKLEGALLHLQVSATCPYHEPSRYTVWIIQDPGFRPKKKKKKRSFDLFKWNV